MSDALIDAQALARWLGYERDGDIARWLRQHRIPYWYGKDRRPVTTVGAIDKVLHGEGEAESIEFEGLRK
ncbi:MAG: hypothetical protein ACRED0_12760 [Gammaproteobacteria bacterium]